MTEKKSAAADPAVEKELEGVPEHMKNDTPEATDTADAQIAALEDALAAAQQEVLYAQAETQNVRRRMEKEAQDARAYAATGFARDVLSVSDNLSRALESIPAEMRESEAMKPLVIGLEATGRELDSVFAKTASPVLPQWACHWTPISIRRWLKFPPPMPNRAPSLPKCRQDI